MQTTTLTLLRVACLVTLLAPPEIAARDPTVKVIAHRNRAAKLTESDVRAIYLKQRLFWDDGRSIVPINREAGSEARELFSNRVFGQSSRRLATYWNRRYFDAGEFPPPTLASDEAVIRFVAANDDAIGYVLQDGIKDPVVVILSLP